MSTRLPIKIVVIAFGIAVAGCSPDRARYTVHEYRADATLRHSQMEKCKDDPGSLAKTPDCINARQAAAFEDRVSLRDMPPVGLSDKSSQKPEANIEDTDRPDKPRGPAQ